MEQSIWVSFGVAAISGIVVALLNLGLQLWLHKSNRDHAECQRQEQLNKESRDRQLRVVADFLDKVRELDDVWIPELGSLAIIIPPNPSQDQQRKRIEAVTAIATHLNDFRSAWLRADLEIVHPKVRKKFEAVKTEVEQLAKDSLKALDQESPLTNVEFTRHEPLLDELRQVARTYLNRAPEFEGMNSPPPAGVPVHKEGS